MVQESYKSTKKCKSYVENKVVPFYGTRCIHGEITSVSSYMHSLTNIRLGICKADAVFQLAWSGLTDCSALETFAIHCEFVKIAVYAEHSIREFMESDIMVVNSSVFSGFNIPRMKIFNFRQYVKITE